MRFETVHILLSLAALEDWDIEALDVKTAFLYGKLEEEIYMEQPEGFEIPGKEHLVWHLKRALYGLKQASLAWWREMNASMKALGFKRILSDAGVFIFRQGKYIIIAIVYVDDALFMGNNRHLLTKKKMDFMRIWECRDLGEATEFLGMRITRDRTKRRLTLDQGEYLQRVLERFKFENKPTRTPLPSGYKPSLNPKQASTQIRKSFQQVIGSLLYIMLGTRPDIAFAVIRLSQFSANPSEEHLEKAFYICCYLLSTPDYTLVFDGSSGQGITAFSDSDWVSDEIMRRSTTGYFIQIAKGPVSWLSRRQKTVALSSTEAEYMALSDCSRQVVWICSTRSTFK